MATHRQALKKLPYHKGVHTFFFAMSMVGLLITIFTTIALNIQLRRWQHKDLVGLYVLQGFATFAFQKFNKFVGLKMPLRAMNKIIVDGSKHKFDFRDQIQLVQALNNQVGAMSHVVDTTYKWNGNTTFNTMKNHNPICTKTNQFFGNGSLIQPPILNKTLDYQIGQIVNNRSINHPL